MEDGSELDRAVREFARVSRGLLAVSVDEDGAVIQANPGFAEAVGSTPDALKGCPFQTFLSEFAARRMDELAEAGRSGEPILLGFLDGEGHPFSVEGIVRFRAGGFQVVGERPAGESETLSRQLQSLNLELSTLARESARKEREHRQTADRLRETLEELDRSYWHLKKIQEFVPICMSCSRIKTGEGEEEWQGLVAHLRNHDVFVSHGYCPTCADELAEGE